MVLSFSQSFDWMLMVLKMTIISFDSIVYPSVAALSDVLQQIGINNSDYKGDPFLQLH